MKISIITLFPPVFTDIFSLSIVGRAQQKGLVQLEVVDLRAFGKGKHKTVDDRPYGGGVGMVLRADILAKALSLLNQLAQNPQGNQAVTGASVPLGKTDPFQ